MKEKIVQIKFFNITFLWEIDSKYRREYLEENELTESDLINPGELKIVFSNLEGDWQYFYFGTKYGFVKPDSIFEDFNDYSDEAEKAILNEILEDLSGKYFTTFDYAVTNKLLD